MPEDKFGNQIQTGDVVEFVYGGDAYATQIDALAEMEGRTWVQATITVFIPAGSVALVEKAPKTSAPKTSAPTSPAAEDAADAAADHIVTTAATETGGDDTALEKPTKSSSSSKQGSK